MSNYLTDKLVLQVVLVETTVVGLVLLVAYLLEKFR